MKDRIAKIRKRADLSQEKFAEMLDLSRNFINQVERGKKNISERTINAICEKIFIDGKKINEKWIRTGKGEMLISPNEDKEYEEAAKQLSNDPLVRSMMVQYWKLNDENKKLFKEFICNLADDMRKNEKISSKTTEEKIQEEVDEYRAELELEARQREKSLALEGQNENTEKKKRSGEKAV